MALAGRCGDAPAYGRGEGFGLDGAQRIEPEGPPAPDSETFENVFAHCEVDSSAPPFLDTLGISDEVGVGPEWDKTCGPRGQTCGHWVNLGCQGCGYQRRIYKSCGDRICCRWCRKDWVSDTQRRFAPVLKELSKYSHQRFITLTIANGPDLKERLRHLRRSMRTLAQRVLWKNSVRLGVRVLEVTFGVDGWHVHFHILAVGSFLKFSDLQSAWKEITGDSHIVRIQKADANVNRELFKYTLKESRLSPELRQVARAALRGVRVVEVIGANADERRDLRAKRLDREKLVCPCCGGGNWCDTDKPLDWWSREVSGSAPPVRASVVRVVQGVLFETGRLL